MTLAALNPYIASRMAREREEDIRRRAEVYRLLAEVCPSQPRWRRALPALSRRSTRLLRSVLPSRARRAAAAERLSEGAAVRCGVAASYRTNLS